MAKTKHKIGITEAGDAGLDLTWVQKLGKVDGAIVITKSATPQFKEAVLEHKDKLIVHATITGFGGSVLEANVPAPSAELAAIKDIIDAGFPMERVVIRIDPIIPTVKGLQTARGVFESAMGMGFSRYRISLIDMYPHVRARFIAMGLPLPYGFNFEPSMEQIRAADDLICRMKEAWEALRPERDAEMRIECCAEPDLNCAIHSGCVSAYDLALLGLEETEKAQVGWQRKNCLCYPGKKELLSQKKPCPNGCLYCYWKAVQEVAKD